MKHNPTNTIVCKAHGEWNGTLEFTYNSGETRVIDTTTLPVYPKKIRPLEKQGPMESRWGPGGVFIGAGLSSAPDPRDREEAAERSANRNGPGIVFLLEFLTACSFGVDPL